MKTIATWAAGTALTLLMAASGAQAAGFQRGTADTDILYEPGAFSSRVGFTYVSPQRGFTSIEGVSGDFGTYTGSYRIPSVALKVGGEDLACAGNYVESFAAEGDYSSLPGGAQPAFVPGGSRVRDLEFESNELSLTCRVSYTHERMRFSFLGGVFAEDFNFEGTSLAQTNLGAALPANLQAALRSQGAQLLAPVSLSVETDDGFSPGFRIGGAFEIPEIALRAQILYRSEVNHDEITGTGLLSTTGDAFVRLANGQQVSVPTAAALFARQGLVIPPTALAGLPTSGAVLSNAVPVFQNNATSPQSLYVNAQTGIAAGTLLFGTFRWTDWSTNRAVVINAGGNASISPYYWDDGYTATLGIGRAFNEVVSGSLAVGFDSGVSTGAETTYTDLYTLSGGLALKNGDQAELRFGGLVGYWTDGSQRRSSGALFNAEVGDDWVYAASVSLKLNF